MTMRKDSFWQILRMIGYLYVLWTVGKHGVCSFMGKLLATSNVLGISAQLLSGSEKGRVIPVSYTNLTLPTIHFV